MKNLFHIVVLLLILAAYASCLYAIQFLIESAIVAAILLMFVAIGCVGVASYYGFYKTGWFADDDKDR